MIQMQKEIDPNQDVVEEKAERSKSGKKTSQGESKKKKSSQQKTIEKLQEENVLLKDQLLRTAAELKNIKFRTEREIAQVILNANKEIIKDLLTVVDDFERSLKSNEEKEGAHFAEGVTLICQKLMSVLKKYGLEPMDSVGKPFTVEQHDALLQVEQKDTPTGIVLDEHEKGYYLNGSILRHAKVLVSK